MNKHDLIVKLADKTQTSQVEAKLHLDAFISVVTEALNNDKPVNLIGFATFSTKLVPARKGRNPKTGDEIDLPSQRRAKCKLSKTVIKK